MSIQGDYTLTLDTRTGRAKVEVWQLGHRLTHERAMTVLLCACAQERKQTDVYQPVPYQRCRVTPSAR